MLRALRQRVRPRRGVRPMRQYRVYWLEVDRGESRRVPVRLLPPAESLDAQRQIERADSLAKVQRGSLMGCGSSRDLATVVPRLRLLQGGLRLRLLLRGGLRLRLRLHRPHVIHHRRRHRHRRRHVHHRPRLRGKSRPSS